MLTLPKEWQLSRDVLFYQAHPDWEPTCGTIFVSVMWCPSSLCLRRFRAGRSLLPANASMHDRPETTTWAGS